MDRCADVFRQMCRQMNRCAKYKSLQMGSEFKVKAPGIRPIRSQWRLKDREKVVVLVVQMVRALAWSARGVDSIPTPVLPFSLVCFRLFVRKHIIYLTFENLVQLLSKDFCVFDKIVQSVRSCGSVLYSNDNRKCKKTLPL